MKHILLALIFLCSLSPRSESFANDLPLEESHFSKTVYTPEGVEQAQPEPDLLKGSVQQTQKSIIPIPTTRPIWLPAEAYTNDQMLAGYGYIIPFLNFGQPIPPNGADMLCLRRVTRYWRDGKCGSCMIHCVPISGYPGNFSFSPTNKNNTDGPRGWLQDTEKSRKGRRLYRFWFDQ